MKLLQLSFGRPYPITSSLRQFGFAILFTLLTVLISVLLMPQIGIFGVYLPLLTNVCIVTWFGGLWPSLLSQVLGAGATLLLIGRPLNSPITTSDLYNVLLFLLIAKLAMFLLLNIQFNRYLQRNKSHLEMIAQSTHDALWEWDLSTDHVWWQGKVSEILGCDKEQINSSINWWRQRIHPDEVERVWAGLRRSIEAGEQSWSDEYRLQRVDGTYITISDHGFIVRDKKGVPTRMFGGMADISAQRKAEQHLVHHVSHDPLTGLPNRAHLLSHLERLLKRIRYQEDGKSVVVMVINIDRFKAVNDSLGHATGNQLLVAVTSRLTRCLRPADIASRLNGDEFCVLLDGVESTTDATHMAERIQQFLSAPIVLENQSVIISVSIGISFAESVKAEDALRQADLAMYQAKAQGRGLYRFFEPSIEARARYVLQAETELRKSFQDGSLQLHYQPIVSLQDGKIFGFEALLRWNREKHGVVGAPEILSVAENAGILSQLERWVFQNCCLCLSKWRRQTGLASNFVMSVNFSGAELSRDSLIGDVKTCLQEANLNGDSFLLEVTETAIMEDNPGIIRNIADLTGLGIRLAIDDFGKGYSSLSRLQDLPISTLKIDRQFIEKIGTEKSQILEAIVALAHKLNLEIVAEGIETEQQFRYLAEHEVSLAQGFYFSDVLTEQDALNFVLDQPAWNTHDFRKLSSSLAPGLNRPFSKTKPKSDYVSRET